MGIELSLQDQMAWSGITYVKRAFYSSALAVGASSLTPEFFEYVHNMPLLASGISVGSAGILQAWAKREQGLPPLLSAISGAAFSTAIYTGLIVGSMYHVMK